MTLRPYQQDAHDAAVRWLSTRTAPCLIEAATGAGKSHIIAELAKSINLVSNGKHVLVLQPSAELVEQNAEKYRQTGMKCSIFSASAGGKSLKHPVVFGTPVTVMNSIDQFDARFAMVILDECHRLSATVKSIIDAMREKNELLRVCGLSATPYRMNEGYLFHTWDTGKPVKESERLDNPYFEKCVFRITAPQLIDQGYLTPPLSGEPSAESYETLKMKLNHLGKFDAADIDQAYHGKGRLTATIVADIIDQSADRNGVMIFAATIQHAMEIMESLPPQLSALVTGETKKRERREIIRAFKALEIKYIVNVDVLTTGFDAPHVDVIAMLRATESPSLFQQIIGRGLRLFEGKANCLILDYAQNVERHCPDGDVFRMVLKVKQQMEGTQVEVRCPDCGAMNEFSARKNDEGYEADESGYFLDLDGNRVETDHGPVPSHYGRRCMGRVYDHQTRTFDRCEYRWTFKECPHCKAENDIAAKYCMSCRRELVDPNEKLKLEFKKFKGDLSKVQRDTVLEWKVSASVSQQGRPIRRIFVRTPYRKFTAFVMDEPTFYEARVQKSLIDGLNGATPTSVSYSKKGDFFRFHAFNEAIDEVPGSNTNLGK